MIEADNMCVSKVETDLAHRTLLDLLKTIEETVGRTPSIRNGPRLIDLDILTYDSEIFDSRDRENRENLDNLEGEMVIPHPRMAEREFVLRPLDE
jgi:dihydroneopterin aldolase / 2-amino-4-hydroxy-6-hydroxymethyldihydropteridine diphosphokinase / dihydropteroate synthase